MTRTYCAYCNDTHIRRDTTGEIIELADYEEEGGLESFRMFTEDPETGMRYMNTFETNDRGEMELAYTVNYYPFVKIDSGWVSADSTFRASGDLNWASQKYISTDSLVEQYVTHYPDGSLLSSYYEIKDPESGWDKTIRHDYSGPDGYSKSYRDSTTKTWNYISYREDNSIQHKSKEIYNTREDCIYEYTWFSEEQIEEHWFRYVYDEYGNWTRKLVYNKDKELIYVIEREILYWRKPALIRK
jgi:hypothetical protein